MRSEQALSLLSLRIELSRARLMKMPIDTLVGMGQPNPQDTLTSLVQDIRLGRLLRQPGGSPYSPRYLIKSGTYPPFLVDLHTNVDDKVAVFTDMRAFVTDTGSVKRMAERDYRLHDIHSQLLSHWADPAFRATALTDLSFAGVCFVNAMLLRFTHIYRLDGEQQVIVRLVLAQWWGQCIRGDSLDYTPEQARRDMTTYSGIRLTESDRLITLSQVPTLSGLVALVDALKTKLNSPKTANLTLTAFLILAKPLVFVYRQDIIIPMALEFPPLFIALVWVALTDRSMKKSYLFTAVQQAQTRDKRVSEVFTSKLKQIVQEPDYV